MKTEGYLSVNGWSKFQHYKNRTPPWLKLHRDLLNNYTFRDLPDASKAHLIMIWLLASQLDNVIPDDAEWIRERINCNEKVDLKVLIDNGFINQLENHASIEGEAEIKAKLDIPITPVKKKPRGRPVAKQKRFHEFYKIYPVHKSAKKAQANWERDKLDEKFDIIVAAVKNSMLNDRQWIEGFIPHPSTYLNQELWTDEASTPSSRRTGNGSFRPEDPRTRHESALERKYGSQPEIRTIDGEVLGQDDVDIRDTVGT
jgi:hypothetical protein